MVSLQSTRTLPLALITIFHILLIYAALLLFAISFGPIVPGLDPSWAFALNRFAHGPEIFGRDLVLTYGPLAYIAVPQHIGANLQIAAAVHLLVWCVLLYLLLALFESGARVGAVFFTVALIFSNRLYFDYWDYLLGVVAILCLVLLLRRPGAVSVLVILAAAIAMSFLVKFTGFILAMLLFSVYLLSRLMRFRETDKRERLLLPLALCAGPLAYLVYNPSLSGLILYTRGSLDMASGYSSAMSSPVTPELAWKAALLCGTVAVATVWCGVKRWVTPAGAVMVILSAWVAFKHGYVRSDPAHAAIFFCFITLVLGFLLAQMAFTIPRIAALGALFLAFSVFALDGASERWPVWTRYWWSPSFNLERVGALLNLRETGALLDRASDDAFRTSDINGLMPTLRGSRVLFFPWNVSYGSRGGGSRGGGSRGGFTTVPLFATQAYSAYTRFLDEQSAERIANASPPIDYIYAEWLGVDGRSPYLDVPATFNEMYKDFAPVSLQGDNILLKRRAVALPLAFHEIASEQCPGEGWSQVPARATPLALSLSMPPSLAGRAMTTFFHLPAVTLQMETRGGKRAEIRFPPGVMSTPFPINYLPWNPQVLNALWTDNSIADPVVRFRLAGPGLRYLNCQKIHYYDATGTPIHIQ